VFKFTTHPALISVTDGVRVAFDYLGATWRKWLPMVALVAAGSFLVYLIVGTVNTSNLYYVDPYTDKIVWDEVALRKYLTGTLAAGGAVALVSLVASWVFYATAITGLRNRPLTLDSVVVRGLLSLVASILMAVVAFVAILALTILTVIVTVLIPPLGILLILILVFAAIPVTLYLEARLILTGMAIFDGFGPIEGIKESWRLSNGAVMRLLGWGVMAFLISLAFSILAAVVSTPLAYSALAPVGQGVSAGITAVASCFTVYLMAVIYESQRARLDPTLYGPPPAPAYVGWGYPGPPWPAYQGTPPAWPGAPGTPPPGFYPGPNAAGPAWPGYQGSPPAWPAAPGTPPAWPAAPGTPPAWPGAPADPTAIPGWVNPNAAPSWSQSAPPGWEQPDPGPAWKPEEGGQTPPSAPKPPEPPASS
jgi:hypothetical protein